MTFTRLAPALAGLALACATASFALAAATDYAFEPVTVEVKRSSATELAVRLLHKPSAKPVEGAVLFRTRLDMSPENMAEHTGAVEALPSSAPGVYRFKADLSMPGRWALKLMAKVPGEAQTVEGSVVFKAKD